jgi:hypothetical protein
VKVRGTATQICDKYLALARDASSSGDRVRAESLLQHAEHYFRLINGGDDARTNPGQDGRRSHAPASVTVSGEMPPEEIIAQPQEQSPQAQTQAQAQAQDHQQQRPSRRERAELAADTENSGAAKTILTEAAADQAPDEATDRAPEEAVVVEDAGDDGEAEVIVETVADATPGEDGDEDAEHASEFA